MLGWAIPEEIISAAPESPWGFPSQLFATRATSAMQRPLTLSHRTALRALPQDGTILDVGVGGGAGSLPLAASASLIAGVDSSQEMLDAFRLAAEQLGVNSETHLGDWPDISDKVAPVDVVVCHHVLFNVPDLEPFACALSSKARIRVVLEMTPTHPLSWMNDLWMLFHKLERPAGPTFEDAAEALREMGLPVRASVGDGPPVLSGFAARADAIALVRKRLCLQPDQDELVAEALGDRLRQRNGLWSAAPLNHSVVTLWWDQLGGSAPNLPPKPF